MMLWDWDYVWQVLPALGAASLVTIQAALAGYGFALVLGLLLTLGRRSQRKPVSWSLSGFVEFVRSTPLLVQLYFLYYGMPHLGVQLSPLSTGILALGLHYSTYLSEVFRSGIDNVPRGQWEAASALGLSRYRRMRYIILPQAIRPIVPALGNYLIAIFKDTPLLASIAIVELLQTAKSLGSESFRYFEPLTIVGLLYILFSLISSRGIRWVELRFARTPAA
jgi:polar amino acid transport system permease protein